MPGLEGGAKMNSICSLSPRSSHTSGRNVNKDAALIQWGESVSTIGSCGGTANTVWEGRR